jgi:RHS repeat-associated protein
MRTIELDSAGRSALLIMLMLFASVVTADDRDTTLRPVTIAPAAGAYTWEYGPFQYDPSGNIAIIGTEYFQYDPMGRLRKSTTQAPDNTGSVPVVYAYDVYGNRTQVDNTLYPANINTNRLSTASYDTAGNLTQWVPPGSVWTRQYTYDSMNMMSGQTTVNQSVVDHIETYVYTADDERLWSIEGAISSNWAPVSHWTLRDLNGKVLRDFIDDGRDSSPDWHVFREYVYRDGLLLATNTENGTEHYSLDHLGTPRLVTNSSRNVIYSHQYFPYGGEWTLGGPTDGSTLRFTGHERDDDFRGEVAGTLDYMHARYYSDNLGRFLSVDPVQGPAENPQSWNRYAYVFNNPVKFMDPLGLCAFNKDGKCIDSITVTASDPWRRVRKAAERNSKFREGEFVGRTLGGITLTAYDKRARGGSVTLGQNAGQYFLMGRGGVGWGGGAKWNPTSKVPTPQNGSTPARGYIGIGGSINMSIGPFGFDFTMRTGVVIYTGSDGRTHLDAVQQAGPPAFTAKVKEGFGFGISGGVGGEAGITHDALGEIFN